MTRRIEQSYKHGHFDPRYPPLSTVAAAPPRHGVHADPGPLEWYAYLARYFPGRRRNDLESLSAYEIDSRPRSAEAPRIPLPSAAVSVWEWEGGRTEPRNDGGRPDAVAPAVPRK
jgi:hypothetical protein